MVVASGCGSECTAIYRDRLQDVREEHLFGIHLYPDAARIDAEAGPREIGTVHGGEFVVVENADGTRSVCDVATGDRVPLNRDRKATEGFLDAFEEYVKSGPAVPTGEIMTAEQAAERLRAFREGKVRPRVLPGGTQLSHRTRLRRLRQRLRSIDRPATGRGFWWSGPIEEAENDLL